MNKTGERTIDISWVSLWRVLFMLIFAVALFLIKEALLVLFLALVISSAIDIPISFLERKRIPRVLGVLLVFISAAAAIFLLLYVVVPVAFYEAKNIIQLFFPYFKTAPFFDNLKLSEMPKFLGNFKGDFSGFSSALISGDFSVVDFITAIFGGVVSFAAVFILSFYLAASREGMERFLRAVLPENLEEYGIDLYLRSKKKLGLWLRGQMILSFAVGLMVWLGLLILGIEYGAVLGILAGIMDIMPFVGPIVVGILAFLVAVSKSLTLGISVIVLFFIINQIESHILAPLVMKKIIGIHPVIVVFAMLAGAQIAGFVGIILAVPTAVIIGEIIEGRKTAR